VIETQLANPDKYTFFVPTEAHWSKIQHLKTNVGTALNRPSKRSKTPTWTRFRTSSRQSTSTGRSASARSTTTRFELHPELREDPAA